MRTLGPFSITAGRRTDVIHAVDLTIELQRASALLGTMELDEHPESCTCEACEYLYSKEEAELYEAHP